MNYLEELSKIDNQVYKNMGEASQKVIDIVEDTIEQLDRDTEEEPIERDELGAINYELDVLIEVWNPKLEFDLLILKRLDSVIQSWYNNVEFINNALGIPKHKG